MKLGNSELVKKYESVKDLLGLSPRYLAIFEYRIGQTDGKSHSQREVGRRFGVTATRIRQIEERVKYELDHR